MKSNMIAMVTSMGAILALVATASHAQQSPLEVSVLGGVHVINKNDTAVPNYMASIPAAAALTYHFNRNFAAEGEFTGTLALNRNVSLQPGGSAARKAPNMLAYQANLRASLPRNSWTIPDGRARRHVIPQEHGRGSPDPAQ